MGEVVTPPAMAPVARTERINAIDILRGVALFGILTANLRGFSSPSEAYFNVPALFSGRADAVAQGLVDFFVSGKCITIFSFLFGLGFAVQMGRADARGQPTVFYLRRLAVLFVFGVIHSFLIWWGDILADYALTGCILYLLRTSKQEKIASWTVTLFLSYPVGVIGLYLAEHFGHWSSPLVPHAVDQSLRDSIQHAIHVNRDGTYLEMVKLRFVERMSSFEDVPYLGTMFILPRFLAGLWVWRSGLLQNVPLYLPVLRRVRFWSGVAGFSCGLVEAAVKFLTEPSYGHMTLLYMIQQLAEQFAVVGIACFYASSILLLCQDDKWQRRLRPFGAVGRMALTNYLTQSLVCTWFFTITKLYGTAGPASDLLPTVLLYGLQLGWSVWWLKRYQFGPVEWLWRSLTYGSAQPMLGRAPVAGTQAAGVNV